MDDGVSVDKKKLREYRSLKSELGELGDRLAELQDRRATAVKLTMLPKGGGVKDLADDVAKMDELIRSWHAKNDALLDTLHEIERSIDAVDNSTERRLLSLRYIDGYSWGDIARIMDYSEQMVYVIHGHALQSLQKLE